MKRLILTLSIGFLSGNLFAQTPNDKLLDEFRNHYQEDRVKDIHSSKSLNPLQWLLNFYELVISDQIAAECDYHPSCGTFSHLALQQNGVIKGLFLTADRLTRCTGYAAFEYPAILFDKEKYGKVLDHPCYYNFKQHNCSGAK